ncbi:MAG: exodeoxyribonuclease VII large subunit [Actinomycetota bacterium]
MTLFEVDDTVTVGQLTRRLSESIKRTFRSELWVQGQIRNLSRSARGHVYFDLIDPVPAGEAPKAAIAVTLFDSTRQVVNRIITRTGNTMRMEDGVEVRIRGTVELYTPRGQVQLNMTSIDPEFTIGRLGADRDQLLRALTEEDLIEANGRLPLPLVPLKIALVTSDGSAAHADFVQEIGGSGYRFTIETIGTRVQGEFAPEEIAASIEHATTLDIDIIAVVRGGGARTDLAAFDTEPVARAIAASRVPVVAGVGHEIDQAVADIVAHTSLKTPTACAQFLIERVAGFDVALSVRAHQLSIAAQLPTARQSIRLDRAARRVVDRSQRVLHSAAMDNRDVAASLERRVSRRMGRSTDRLTQIEARVGLGTAEALRRALRRCNDASDDLATLPVRHLREASRTIDLLEARRSAVDPAHALRRGWSITTTADGQLVRSTTDAPVGSQVDIRVADGTITGVVTDNAAESPSPPTNQEPA